MKTLSLGDVHVEFGLFWYRRGRLHGRTAARPQRDV